MQQAETVIVSTCRCGWICLTPTVGESMRLLDEHVAEQKQGDHAGRPMAMSNPLNKIASAFLRQQARIYRTMQEQNHALTTLYRAPMPRITTAPKRHNRFARLVDWFMSGPAAVHYDH